MDRLEALNRPGIQLAPADMPVVGWDAIGALIGARALATAEAGENPSCVIGIDGYVGTDWGQIIDPLAQALADTGISAWFHDNRSSLLLDEELDELLEPYLGSDPVFGRLYKNDLESLLDADSVAMLIAEIKRWRREEQGPAQCRVLVCYGTGTLITPLRKLCDLAVYADLSRERALQRNKSWTQLAGKTQSIGPKRLYYVDFPVNDRHRNGLLDRLDYYLDGNNQGVLLSASALRTVCSALTQWPFKLKYMYEPGPWGGQWLKRVRHLPQDWVNCAWSYEVIAPEMSLLVAVGETVLELPWETFYHLEYDRVMGDVPRSRFGGQFPIRYDYLDTIDGGDLSIQVHPTTGYIQEQFDEPYHQGEMYYIVEAKEGATVNLGLTQEADKEAFREAAEQAEREGIPFDYRHFVHQVPADKHDLLLIPPGTVHGSGEGLVVLEISATTYRYTFKIYDHLRPDLNGVMRPIHLEHAFNVIKWFRRGKWVDRHLKQAPSLVRSGEGWAEYLIGDRPEFFHLVFRPEFDEGIEDDTAGKFHLLTLVEGKAVELHSLEHPERKLAFGYSETILVPAGFGPYQILNRGQGRCKIAKARLR